MPAPFPSPRASRKRFADLDRQHEIGELKIKISGCINACGHHHAGHIGILGVDKKGVEFYQLQLGGSGAEDASIGDIMGPGFGEHEIADAVERVVDVYLDERKDGERFLDTYRRIGMEPFKDAAYQDRGMPRVSRLIKAAPCTPIASRAVADDAALPDGAVLVSLARFQKERDTLLARNTPLGVRLQVRRKSRSCWATMSTACRWSRWNFPNSATAAPFPGRACCAPGWASPARSAPWAIFSIDQINYQHRVGFDAWEVPDAFHAGACSTAPWREMTNVYQPSADGRKTIRELRSP